MTSFGSPMPGRQFSAGSPYKYGFNGKENDNETVSTGEGTQDYGMRIYNPALGRFLSVDPLSKDYPELTPYQFASNMPIIAIDLDGLEADLAIYGKGNGDNYHQSDINAFQARAMRIKGRLGYNVEDISTGSQFLNKLESYTKSDGSIRGLITFSHGGSLGMFLNWNEGFYVSGFSQGGKGERNTDNLTSKIDANTIKFTNDAVWIMAFCNGANGMESSVGGEIAMKTGVTTIAATGYVGPENVDGKPTGNLYTDGTFIKFEKYYKITTTNESLDLFGRKTTTETVRYTTQMPDTQSKNQTIEEGVRMTDLGNTINPNEYLPK